MPSPPRRILFLGPASACHVTRWVAFLRRRGHEVLLASLHEIPADQRRGTIALAGRLTSGATPASALPGAWRRVRQLAREFRPDVTIAYYMSSYGLLAALAGLRPWVGAAAGGDVLVDAFDPWHRRLRTRLLVGYTLRRCSGMLAWAPHVARRLIELGFAESQILVQPRGVDRTLFRYREPRRRQPGEPLRVLSIRWLKPLYRVDTLVEALLALAARGVAFEARIGGEGSERARLEQCVTEAGANDRIRFVGAIAADDVPAAMSWADVYVSTSSSDGASSSLFEALSVGVYPLVSDIEANRAYVSPGKTGDLFAVGDAAALAGSLEALSRDDERRRGAVLAARPLVSERLDYEKNMARIEAFLLGVALEKRPA
ncbi:MAG: glycosyltransferase [Acidobacteriota bacterium]|nr:MAG: glycosyltransferase [Acidobacteriota bacterium]